MPLVPHDRPCAGHHARSTLRARRPLRARRADREGRKTGAPERRTPTAVATKSTACAAMVSSPSTTNVNGPMPMNPSAQAARSRPPNTSTGPGSPGSTMPSTPMPIRITARAHSMRAARSKSIATEHAAAPSRSASTPRQPTRSARSTGSQSRGLRYAFVIPGSERGTDDARFVAKLGLDPPICPDAVMRISDGLFSRCRLTADPTSLSGLAAYVVSSRAGERLLAPGPRPARRARADSRSDAS